MTGMEKGWISLQGRIIGIKGHSKKKNIWEGVKIQIQGQILSEIEVVSLYDMISHIFLGTFLKYIEMRKKILYLLT